MFKSAPEVDIEDCVDDRIERRIDVTKPDDKIDHPSVCVLLAGGTEREDYVHEEERQPAEDERAHDYPHCPCRPALLRQRDALLLLEELRHLTGPPQGRV